MPIGRNHVGRKNMVGGGANRRIPLPPAVFNDEPLETDDSMVTSIFGELEKGFSMLRKIMGKVSGGLAERRFGRRVDVDGAVPSMDGRVGREVSVEGSKFLYKKRGRGPVDGGDSFRKNRGRKGP